MMRKPHWTNNWYALAALRNEQTHAHIHTHTHYEQEAEIVRQRKAVADAMAADAEELAKLKPNSKDQAKLDEKV